MVELGIREIAEVKVMRIFNVFLMREGNSSYHPYFSWCNQILQFYSMEGVQEGAWQEINYIVKK